MINKTKVLGVGGGTGLSTLFRGLRNRDIEISGIISVTDDGGSSGRLREGYGILPPGDFRNCLVAMSDTEPLLQKLFQHRFDGESELSGHSFGNLFILAMEKITGSFEKALEESCKILNVKGSLLPSTLDQINLTVEMKDGTTIEGESNIQYNKSGINNIFLNPNTPIPNPKAQLALTESDYIILGPGSLYTSIIPNLLVPKIVDSLRGSKAKKIYVCNVATQLSETDGFDVCDHIEIIQKFTGNMSLDYIIINNAIEDLGSDFPTSKCVEIGHVHDDWGDIILEDLMNPNFKGHHDSDKLADVIMKIIN